MNPLLKRLLNRLVRKGALEVVDPKGGSHRFGDGTGQAVRVRITTPRAEWALITDPELKLGECFMDGSFVVEEGSIYDFLILVTSNIKQSGSNWWLDLLSRLRIAFRRFAQHNTIARARRNIAHHYDLDGRLYSLFLDADRQYSCAYFERPGLTLDEAQLAKKRHIAAKLRLEQGQRVLDIGCGWGGLGLYLAELARAKVTGVTLSEEQHALARKRAAERGLEALCDFRLQDYRTVEGPFDRIVSVGMFEHVGVGHYQEFFDTSARLLGDDGIMLLHAIGRFDGPGATNRWIQRYIFPGGYIPALSEVLPRIERAGLLVSDIEILRLHYAETLKAWRERFLARRDEAVALYDERFARMWEFYLAASETAFRNQDMMVFQIQLVKNQTAVPLTRGYVAEEEERLRERESPASPVRLAGE